MRAQRRKQVDRAAGVRRSKHLASLLAGDCRGALNARWTWPGELPRGCRWNGDQPRDDHRVQNLVVLEHHHEVRVEPLGDRRIADRAALVGRGAELLFDGGHGGAALRGFDPGGLDGHLAVNGQGFANAGTAAPSANATTVIFNVRASMAFSCGRRLDRGGNIPPAVAKSAAVAMRPTRTNSAFVKPVRFLPQNPSQC